MKIYYEPINLLEWNMFEKISGIGHIEGLLATKSMENGDIILLHAGKQNRKYKSGIYSIGEIVTAPFIFNEQID
ncbi:MAG: HNH endonuclease, partial [Clostridia bacterium]|nr:HNH endonuclease [Clostridia bacterium]